MQLLYLVKYLQYFYGSLRQEVSKNMLLRGKNVVVNDQTGFVGCNKHSNIQNMQIKFWRPWHVNRLMQKDRRLELMDTEKNGKEQLAW